MTMTTRDIPQWLVRGQSAIEGGDPYSALEWFSRVLDVDSSNAVAQRGITMTRAMLFGTSKTPAGTSVSSLQEPAPVASAQSKEAPASPSGAIDDWTALATEALRRGSVDVARDLFERVLAMDKGNLRARHGMTTLQRLKETGLMPLQARGSVEEMAPTADVHGSYTLVARDRRPRPNR